MDVQRLGLETGEAVGDGLELFARGVEMVQPLLQAEVAQIVGAEFVAKIAGVLLVLLEKGVFPVGAKDMVAVLDLVDRVASFFPFHATYWLNGHSFMEQELKRKQVGFRKSDNAFLAVDDVAQLQAAADRLSPEIIRKQLDYWTFLLGPKFSKKERSRMNLSRFYAISQIEYCRNFIFKRNFPIHKIFERR